MFISACYSVTVCVCVSERICVGSMCECMCVFISPCECTAVGGRSTRLHDRLASGAMDDVAVNK